MAKLKIDSCPLPQLPERLNILSNPAHKKVTLCNGEQVIFPVANTPVIIKFESFFDIKDEYSLEYYKMLRDYVKNAKMFRVDAKSDGIAFSGEMIIDSFNVFEMGGAVDRIFYELTLSEYKSPSFTKITKEVKNTTVKTENIQRKDIPRANTVNHSYIKYTVRKNDTLSGIAKEFLGDFKRYTEIYSINRDIIKNVNLIYVGQVLKIPKK